ATAGTATFTGSSTLSGTANLYDVTVNGTTLILSASSILGIANTLTITAGTFNTTTNTPNTVTFNGTGAQSVNALTYYHLVLANGNTKTAAGNITVNGNFTINPSTTFNGSSFTHTLSGNWINNGIFTAATSTVKLSGTANTTVTGATTFYILTISKSSSTSVVTLVNNISVPTLNMTTGNISTGSNTLTITTTRTGAGIILGTITRTHAFTTGTAYAFEGADNSITFTAVSGVTSVTVNVVVGNVSDFPNSGAINRVYNITIPSGTYTATLRLHYEDAELNGSSETAMQLWQYNGSAWGLSGKTTNSTTSNYVEQTGLTNITNRWTCSDDPAVMRWNGSVNTAWNNASNWTPAVIPTAIDVAQIGTIAFTNQPSISTAVTVKSISFGSTQAATLTIGSGGSLVTNGNITGTWAANATHTISAGNQNMTVNGDLLLSDGTSGHVINLSAGSSTIIINGSLTETGGANINFTGNTALSIKNDFTYSSGTFTSGTGTVTYNGTGVQLAAPVNYNHLVINKTSGIASVNAASAIAGNLTLTSGELDFNADATIAGNVSIASGTNLYGNGITLNVGGNWSGSGTFNPGNGLVNFNGTGAQSVAAAIFNDVTINKASGIASLSGNITLAGNLNVQAGTLNLGTYTADRNSSGGQFTLANGTTILIGGTNNFPQNYSANIIGSSSTVNYNGTGVQSVTGASYGNLVFSNGGTNAKTLTGSIDVAGDITFSSGSTTDADVYTVNLSGNLVNTGTFTPSAGTLVLNGNGKTITGNATFNKVTVNGSYTVAGSDITYNGLLYVTSGASYAAGSGTATVNGDLTNSSTLTSSGTTTFTGTTVQTIHLINALSSTSTGIVNFNGNVSPVLNSTSTPVFANLNINNTAGVNPSVNWLIGVSMTVGSGGIFNGGNSTHTILGSFTNNGTVTSSGTMNFAPSSAATIKLSGTSFSSTGIVTFGGAGLITITGSPASLNDVRITNTNSAGITPPSGWTMDGDFIIASNSLFNAGSYTHTVGGDIESNGTLDGGTSTFVMSSPNGLLTGSPNTTFNHFTITGSIASNSDFNVAGNFTNNGTYDGSIGTLIMTGSNPSVIGGTTTPSTIAQLTIAKTGPSTLTTMAVNLANVFTLYINSGTLFTSTYGITQDAGGGILTISNGATLRLGGTNALPGFSAFGLDVYSTVDYAGSNQVVGNAASYGNLMISAAGTKIGTAPLIIQNDFTLSAGTFNSAVSVTHTVGGNWTMTGGTFSNASSTIVFNGTGDQYINSTGAFNNLTVNKTSGILYLSGAATVNAILNFSSGKISIGNNNLTIGNSGTITGAGTSSYIIATGSGTLNQQVTAGTSKSFPVGLTAAYSPATIALTAGSTTDNFSLRMLAGAYTNGSTSGGAVTANAVNATWLISEAVPGGSNATVTLQWPTSLELSGFNRVFSRLDHFSGGVWDYGSSDIAASGSNPYTVSRSGFTSFSPFSVSMFKALPVTWLSVNGTHKGNDNYIYWSTASEVNNNYFVVEVSTDGINFNEAGRVNGNGNSTTAQNYSFIHANVANGTYFYRIKQVDIDEHSSYSSTIKIVGGSAPISSPVVYPNPVSDQANLILTAEKPAVVSVIIMSINGQVMYTASKKLVVGVNQVNINFQDKASGVYILKVTDGQGYNEIVRFIKK
ncbi:MAG: T9SS type A sorting domain-containing protein, partial [Bacteroidota bacterium]